MNLTFIEILLLIITVAVSVVAIKITFSFNINEFLKSRDEKLRSKIKNYCTHVIIKEVDEKICIQSSFISPSGTLNWICQRCGSQLYHLDQNHENKRIEYLLKNPKELAEQEKKFQKLLKKAELV